MRTDRRPNRRSMRALCVVAFGALIAAGCSALPPVPGPVPDFDGPNQVFATNYYVIGLGCSPDGGRIVGDLMVYDEPIYGPATSLNVQLWSNATLIEEADIAGPFDFGGTHIALESDTVFSAGACWQLRIELYCGASRCSATWPSIGPYFEGYIDW